MAPQLKVLTLGEIGDTYFDIKDKEIEFADYMGIIRSIEKLLKDRVGILKCKNRDF